MSLSDFMEFFFGSEANQSSADRRYARAYQLGANASDSGHYEEINGRKVFVDHCPFKEGTEEYKAYQKGASDARESEDKGYY